MSPHSSGPMNAPLHTLTDLLSNTPTIKLPHVIHHLLTALRDSQSSLSTGPDQIRKAKDASSTSVSLHKYKTQLSTLLLGKSAEGRWVAAVLIKTTIELGGWEILQGCASWIRGLLAILGVCLQLRTLHMSPWTCLLARLEIVILGLIHVHTLTLVIVETKSIRDQDHLHHHPDEDLPPFPWLSDHRARDHHPNCALLCHRLPESGHVGCITGRQRSAGPPRKPTSGDCARSLWPSFTTSSQPLPPLCLATA